MKNEKGITLVALVITIIVLLILAAVSIAALSGQNGILTNASKAKVEDELATAKDTIALAVNEALSDYYDNAYVKGTPSVAAQSAGAYIVTKLSANTQVTALVDGTIALNTDFNLKAKDYDGNTISGKIDANGGLTWKVTAAPSV